MPKERSKGSILIVDDEPNILKTMTISLHALGYTVHGFVEAEEALKAIDRDIRNELDPDLAFVDLMMYPMNGIVMLEELHRRLPDLTTVIITAHGTIDTAITALKSGAYDYLQKPFELKELTEFVERVMLSASKKQQARQDRRIVTENPIFQGVLRMAERIAQSPLAVLIEGETGTGKELLADHIHMKSDRASSPIVKLNCAALSAELIESELFGHVKGSFTGALKDREGRVEAANGGTLFLDEVGEMPPGMQAKLLRFLQNKEYQRVGENATRIADVRVIAATNRNLEEAIEQGNFREDLFYRLSGVRLLIPPLRLRREDILAMARLFAAAASKAPVAPRMSAEVEQALLGYDWRGNVRELENVMMRAAILAFQRPTIELSDLPEYFRADDRGQRREEATSSELRSLEEVERDHIAFVMGQTPSLEEAARVLKIDSATLWRKRKRYKL